MGLFSRHISYKTFSEGTLDIYGENGPWNYNSSCKSMAKYLISAIIKHAIGLPLN